MHLGIHMHIHQHIEQQLLKKQVKFDRQQRMVCGIAWRELKDDRNDIIIL